MELLFVYNANSGKANNFLDIAHKLFSPKTYSCGLCNITHGVFVENSVWKKFRKNSDLLMTFLYKNDFEGMYDRVDVYPVVFLKSKNTITILVEAYEFDGLGSAEELVSLLKEKLHE